MDSTESNQPSLQRYNGYNIFGLQFRKDNPNITGVMIFFEMSKAWNELSDSAKAEWNAKAKTKNKRLEEEYIEKYGNLPNTFRESREVDRDEYYRTSLAKTKNMEFLIEHNKSELSILREEKSELESQLNQIQSELKSIQQNIREKELKIAKYQKEILVLGNTHEYIDNPLSPLINMLLKRQHRLDKSNSFADCFSKLMFNNTVEIDGVQLKLVKFTPAKIEFEKSTQCIYESPSTMSCMCEGECYYAPGSVQSHGLPSFHIAISYNYLNINHCKFEEMETQDESSSLVRMKVELKHLLHPNTGYTYEGKYLVPFTFDIQVSENQSKKRMIN